MKKAVILLAIIGLLSLTSCTGNEEPGTISQISQDNAVMEQSSVSVDIAPYMALNTADYGEKTIEEFDKAFEPYQHIYPGYGRVHPEITFMESLFYACLQLSALENNALPCLGLGTEVGTVNTLDYLLYWDIKDTSSTTVNQRDAAIKNSIKQVNEIYAPYADGEQITLEEIQALLDKAEPELSSSDITIRLIAESIN